MGKEKMSLSKKIKNSVKNAVKFINDFENTAADIAIEKGYDYVICGHIHHPEIKNIKTEKGEVIYMNSGDWIENLSALEYNNGEWSVFDFRKQFVACEEEEEEQDLKEMLDVAKLYQSFVS
jgi:UDP-2,3-diacylglucosamine pyrophosphatase LpxH